VLLFHLLISDLNYNQYTLRHYQNPAILVYNFPSFHSHSTNISLVANLKPRGKGAAETG
jgi:hypothetical protein